MKRYVIAVGLSLMSYFLGEILLRATLRQMDDSGFTSWQIIGQLFDVEFYKSIFFIIGAVLLLLIFVADLVTPKRANLKNFVLISAFAGAYNAFMIQYDYFSIIENADVAGFFAHSLPVWLSESIGYIFSLAVLFVPHILLVALKTFAPKYFSEGMVGRGHPQ